MAGTPIRTQQENYLTEHETEVFEMRASGASWRKVAGAFLTSLFVLDKWLKAKDHPERYPAWKALDTIAAEAKAGEAEEILEDGENSPLLMPSDRVRLIIARSDLAKWTAGMMDRQRFGAAKDGANLTVNLNLLHLTAVRDLALAPPPAPISLIGEADYEVLPAEPSLDQLLGAP